MRTGGREGGAEQSSMQQQQQVHAVQAGRQAEAAQHHQTPYLDLCALKLHKADALELAGLAVHREPHADDAANLAKSRGQLVAHLVLACKLSSQGRVRVGGGGGAGVNIDCTAEQFAPANEETAAGRTPTLHPISCCCSAVCSLARALTQVLVEALDKDGGALGGGKAVLPGGARAAGACGRAHTYVGEGAKQGVRCGVGQEESAGEWGCVWWIRCAVEVSIAG